MLGLYPHGGTATLLLACMHLHLLSSHAPCRHMAMLVTGQVLMARCVCVHRVAALHQV
jgi:hypothetical protein